MTTSIDAGDGAPPVPASPVRAASLLIPIAVGAAVSVTLGVYGGLHTPAPIAVQFAGAGTLALKSWLATLAALLAVAQLLSALVMFGRIPVAAPSWIAAAHRWSGRAAFAVAIPVAVQCLYSFGFQGLDGRTLVHSLVGCVFFGAFTVKMLILTRDDTPGWALPIAGGVVFAGLMLVWLTSALWFFTG